MLSSSTYTHTHSKFLAIDRTKNRILIKAGHVLFIVNDDSSLWPLSYIFYFIYFLYNFLCIFFVLFFIFIRLFLCKVSKYAIYKTVGNRFVVCFPHDRRMDELRCDAMRSDGLLKSSNKNKNQKQNNKKKIMFTNNREKDRYTNVCNDYYYYYCC